MLCYSHFLSIFASYRRFNGLFCVCVRFILFILCVLLSHRQNINADAFWMWIFLFFFVLRLLCFVCHCLLIHCGRGLLKIVVAVAEFAACIRNRYIYMDGYNNMGWYQMTTGVASFHFHPFNMHGTDYSHPIPFIYSVFIPFLSLLFLRLYSCGTYRLISIFLGTFRHRQTNIFENQVNLLDFFVYTLNMSLFIQSVFSFTYMRCDFVGWCMCSVWKLISICLSKKILQETQTHTQREKEVN